MDIARGLLTGSRRQGGFTLVEMLVGMVMGLVVLGCAMGFYMVASDSQDAAGKRSELTRDVQVAMNRMAGEIRQSVAATVISSQVIDLETLVVPSAGGAKVVTHVRYDCSVAGTAGTYNCTRDYGPAYGTLSGVQSPVLKSVTNSDVFAVGTGSVATNPLFVGIKLNVSFKSLRNGDANQAVQLQDGVDLRNISTL